jgi:site-specific DNA recombinase
VDRQRQDCEKEATHRSWEVVGTYVDNDVSASSRNPRPAYERMLEDVRTGRVDAVLVWDVDRLTRRLSRSRTGSGCTSVTVSTL